ncbi:MAG: hypothetical protein IJP33_00925, partial [Firmicutes bacterium]|nr:hypothetical protein [Bacillota bacterium]
MALTDEDKKRLSKEDQRRIEEATARWEQADAAGDESGKKAAADEAKKIREQAGYYTDSYGRYAGEWGEQEEQLFLDGFEDKDSSVQNGQQAVISAERPAPPRSYDGMYSVEGGSGKSF